MHVPSAWMSLFVYVCLAVCGVAGLVWRLRVYLAAARACAPLGAAFTLLALADWGDLGQADLGRVVGVGCASQL